MFEVKELVSSSLDHDLYLTWTTFLYWSTVLTLWMPWSLKNLLQISSTLSLAFREQQNSAHIFFFYVQYLLLSPGKQTKIYKICLNGQMQSSTPWKSKPDCPSLALKTLPRNKLFVILVCEQIATSWWLFSVSCIGDGLEIGFLNPLLTACSWSTPR